MIQFLGHLALMASFFLVSTCPLVAQSDANNIYYTSNHGSGQSGITATVNVAISACGTTTLCTVVIPVAYPGGGVAPGSSPNPTYAQPNTAGALGAPGSIPSNIIVLDQRGGGAITLQNGEHYVASNISSGTLVNCSHSTLVPASSPNIFCQTVMESANDGGSNYNYGAVLGASITNWTAQQTSLVASTEGQAIAGAVASIHNGLGDTLGMSIQSYCHGGFTAGTDEACEAADLQAFQAPFDGNPQDYIGTVTTGGVGATTVTISASQGEGTQGAGRYLLLTKGVIQSPSVLMQVTPTVPASPDGTTAAVPTIYTVKGAATLPVSTTVATLNYPTSGIPAGTGQIKPAFSSGGISSISPGTLLCIADPFGPLEFVYAGTIVGNAITITTVRPHPASAIITSGGACGSFIDLTSDNVTSSTYKNLRNQVLGTMLHAWPILETTSPQGTGSATTQQIYVAIQRGGAWGNTFSQWASSAQPNNTFFIYPGAEVYSVANSQGEQSDTFALSPNNVNWATNASVDLPDHPAVNVSLGQWLTQQEFPGDYNGLILSLYGAVNGSTLAQFNNFAPTNLYNNNGGSLPPPIGVQVNGDLQYAFQSVIGGAAGDLYFGCSLFCNQYFQNILQAQWQSGTDNVQFNEHTGEFGITANNNNFRYDFKVDGFQMPTEASATAASANNFEKMYFSTGNQVCLTNSSASVFCATKGPASSTTNDIPTFSDTSGSVLQDSGVSISSYAGSGEWLGLPTSGHSAVGFGGSPGTIVAAGYAQSSSVFFTDTVAGDLVMREQPGGNIRFGTGSPGNNGPSTVSVSQAAFTLNLGTKLTETHALNSNATSGVATLSSGTVTVATTAIGSAWTPGTQTGDVVELTLQNCMSCGFLHVQSVSSGSGFTIASSSGSDASSVYWMIHHLN